MPNKSITSLVATIGVSGAAARLLDSKTFDGESEAFLCDNYQSLGWESLLRWLATPEPESTVGLRPNALVVQRLVKVLPDDSVILRMMLPAALRAVHDADVHDDIVVSLRPRLEEWCWLQIAANTTAGPVFNAIRTRELEMVQHRTYPPPELLSEDRSLFSRRGCSTIDATTVRANVFCAKRRATRRFVPT